jgi:hypothetical protein
VSVHKATDDTAEPAASSGPDMDRAAKLISLHQSVKLRYQDEGLDEELGKARSDVQRVMASLEASK